jgi:carboxyl-terminal processing protease
VKQIKYTLLSAVLVLSLSASAAQLQPEQKAAKIARTLAYELPREHLSRHNLDDDTAKLMFDNYLSMLDPERVYFLKSDIDKFKQKEFLLDDEIKSGDVQFAYDVFETLKERVRNRTAYTKELLQKGFDLTIDEEYHWKRKDAPWCANENEWNDLWRRRIKNEYLRRIVSKEIADAEAATKTNTITTAIGPLKKPTTIAAINDLLQTAPIYSESIDEVELACRIYLEKNEDYILPAEKLTPEEFINKYYEQYLGILEDSDSNFVLQKYLSAFARSYDPHCDYMSPETSEDFDIDMKLSLVGIGAMLRPEDGAAKIVSLVPGGPADSDTSKNKLRPGDKIIAVGQGNEEPVSILHWPLYKAVRIIRGKKGSRIVLTVIPATDPSGTSTKKVVLIRDEVKLEERAAKSKIKTIKDANGVPHKLGVIKLPAFYADMQGLRNNPDSKSASRDVAKLLRKMREENVEGIILDLRNNGGGSLREAVIMTGLFIETGPTVQVRERRSISILPDINPTIAYSGPMLVLVNRLSASASEILAAALQDYGRAVIVGDTKTHGKGSVQTILRLNRNASMGKMKVTNALFYRISGGSTQLKGVTPDIVISSPFDFMEFGEDFLTHPMEWSTIRSAIYSPFGDLRKTSKVLAAKSERRRANDESFAVYNKLLDRIKETNNSEAMSLNIETRRSKAKAEKELLDIQNKLMEQGQNSDDDNDIVEDESLRILLDLVKITNDQNGAQTVLGSQKSE